VSAPPTLLAGAVMMAMAVSVLLVFGMVDTGRVGQTGH
jgi:hypothetical protein